MCVIYANPTMFRVENFDRTTSNGNPISNSDFFFSIVVIRIRLVASKSENHTFFIILENFSRARKTTAVSLRTRIHCKHQFRIDAKITQFRIWVNAKPHVIWLIDMKSLSSRSDSQRQKNKFKLTFGEIPSNEFLGIPCNCMQCLVFCFTLVGYKT